jgi:DNA gyrase subunit A
LLVFTNQGRLYWLKALDVPDVGVSGRGKAIANLVEFQPNEKPSSVLAVKEFRDDQFVVMLTTDGIIKKTRLSEFKNVRRGGINAINLRPKSDLFSAQLSGGKNTIVIGTKLGRALRFKESDVRPMGRTASGVRGIRLKPKDKVIGMIVAGPDEKFIFTASERGYGKKTAVDQYPLKRRGGQGVLNLRITPKISWSSPSRARSSASRRTRSGRSAGPPRASGSSTSRARTASALSPRSARAELRLASELRSSHLSKHERNCSLVP